ncbi:hypothetical protein [Nitrosomonas communis]|uniref:Uncharacterized protein n=1 Tax=Nitrosomonas communis TaxID=44574 RepID=A0A1I4RVD7_9PROT|nr:hypothetical protein [Nitrosomonas communis]SFM56044.1 hypothetical protein SAMN05421863_103535 [Nitrosomonas communis]
MSNFIDKCLIEEILLDDLDDYVSEWHDTKPSMSLYQFLGMIRSE